jgi:hypothetical protein
MQRTTALSCAAAPSHAARRAAACGAWHALHTPCTLLAALALQRPA